MEVKVVHIRKERLCCVDIVFLEYIFFLFFRFGYSVVLNEPIDCSYVFPSASGSPRMPSVCAVFLRDKEAFLGKNNWFRFRDSSNNRATRSTVTVSGVAQLERADVLYKENVRLETRKHFFSVRVVDEWNRIPDEIKEQRTINTFKNRYDEWIRSESGRQA